MLLAYYFLDAGSMAVGAQCHVGCDSC